uniref:Chitinase n=1 Tax=Lymnaea stagnalis TaxID=6523 RepID=A0A193PCP1_LYMST|nr:chitinase [Lymnaea stagnalis]
MAWYLAVLIMLTFAGLPTAFKHNSTSSTNTFVCYYMATSFFPATQVPADLCTHIIYSYGIVSPNGIQPISSADLQNYKTLVQLKKNNPNLKVLLSLQPGFESVVSAGSDVMKKFAKLAVSFLSNYGFDGIDLDWEFPKSKDKENFKLFIQILYAETRPVKMLMSAALPNSISALGGYDVPTFASAMDFMTAMTYDFHLFIKNIDNTTGYNSPLFTPKGEPKLFSMSAVLSYYLNVGFPSNKLLMGISTYGRSWTLTDAAKHDLHAPAKDKGLPGPYRHLRGVYVYPDVCVALQQGAKSVIDDTNGAAYLYNDTTWVAYDEKATILKKLAWMKSQSLGGVGVWAMHLDDNTGVCKLGSFPLLNAIKSNL